MADRAFQARRCTRLASLVAGGTLLAAAGSLPAHANFAFGINDKQQIIQINLDNAANPQTLLYEAGSIICGGLGGTALDQCLGNTGGAGQTYFSNSFAYDKTREHFYFLDYQGNLRFYDFTTGSPLTVVAPKATNGLNNVTSTSTQYTANAAFANDAYWYFIANDAPGSGGISTDATKLVKFAFTYDGANQPNGGTATLYSVGGLSGPGLAYDPAATNPSNASVFSFGDVAINPNTNKLYGALTNGAFFSVDLGSCSGSSCGNASVLKTYWDGTPNTGSGANPSLQIAFDADYAKLYGHTFSANSNGNTNTAGGWGLVDVATGNYTQFSGAQTFTSSSLRDIAGTSPFTQEVPGPLPVLGAGAAFGWTRRLRRRLRGAQAERSSR